MNLRVIIIFFFVPFSIFAQPNLRVKAILSLTETIPVSNDDVTSNRNTNKTYGKGLGVEYFYSRTFFDYGLSSSLIHASYNVSSTRDQFTLYKLGISPFIQIKPIKVSSLRIGFNPILFFSYCKNDLYQNNWIVKAIKYSIGFDLKKKYSFELGLITSYDPYLKHGRIPSGIPGASYRDFYFRDIEFSFKYNISSFKKD
ncbi:MAG: hypothetical protein WBJ36_01605 [Tenuifilum sp.]|uniref:hypothetical protein n=1 Tax=Tenuifilum sp. TaxID=2760880 RepID=UPI001B512657|nr:hypothetical protein [Bacteroidales bacterium]HON71309.1 hypothetical protein [Tenuifilum sp.]HRR11961.1 hypothetical protein [Tenuifilum sp.]HRS44637.1 hypothetical protein [Tenuifilum sp.]HRU86109.1 hypothetical protein [Tenuifilum sp.]